MDERDTPMISVVDDDGSLRRPVAWCSICG
jgi:hypothetical protein